MEFGAVFLCHCDLSPGNSFFYVLMEVVHHHKKDSDAYIKDAFNALISGLLGHALLFQYIYGYKNVDENSRNQQT